jgi:hypothetical protein
MSPGDIVTVCAGTLRGAIGTVESKDEWGYNVRLWGDEKPEPRYFDYADLEMLAPATARSRIIADLSQVNRAIQSYDVARARGHHANTTAVLELRDERAALLEMLAEVDEKHPVP